MSYQPIEVKSSADKRKFLDFPVQLYQKYPQWIQPLDTDIESIFSEKNKLIQKGSTVIRWILENKNKEIIGRIAAFVNVETAYREQQPTGGIGFFECIYSQEAANVLFDLAQEWLKNQGIEAMDGSINFGSREAWWGILIDGFEYEPTYRIPWTPPYYIELFENYGFKEYFQQYVYASSVQEANVMPLIKEKAYRVFANTDYVFKKADVKNLDKYAEDFKIIFNKAWAKFTMIKEMQSDEARATFQKMKPIMDTNLVWFAYTSTGEPIAFFLGLPDINGIIKHLNGKMNLFSKLKFALLRWRGAMTKCVGVIFGVVPEYQGRGLESAIGLVYKIHSNTIPNFPYQSIEMNWVGDFNIKMLRFISQIGGVKIKTLATYRFLFDRSKPFERHPKI